MINDNPPLGISTQDGAASNRPFQGTLVIRTWYEAGQASGFRARVTHSQKPGDEPTSISTADPAEVLNVVQQWLSTRPMVLNED